MVGGSGQWKETAGSGESVGGEGVSGVVSGRRGVSGRKQESVGREESVGGGGSVQGGCRKWEEDVDSREVGPVGGWVSGWRVGQRESGAVRGECNSERRVVQLEEGEAVGHVLILLFDPLN